MTLDLLTPKIDYFGLVSRSLDLRRAGCDLVRFALDADARVAFTSRGTR